MLKLKNKIKNVIIKELRAVEKTYGEPRRTTILYDYSNTDNGMDEPAEEYPVHVFLSREGYFKKITPQSLRMSGEQKFKEGDSLRQTFETTSNAEILFFTDQRQIYRTRLSEFDDAKASVLGDYLPAKLSMDPGETVIYAILPGDYSASILFVYENGKAARIPLSAYQITSNRRRLTGAYTDKSPLTAMFCFQEEMEVAAYTSQGRCLIFQTAQVPVKNTRTTPGVQAVKLTGDAKVEKVCPVSQTPIVNHKRYRATFLPSAGMPLRQEDSEEKQLSLL